MLLCIFRAGYAGKLAMLLHQHAVVISLLSPLAVDMLRKCHWVVRNVNKVFACTYCKKQGEASLFT